MSISRPFFTSNNVAMQLKKTTAQARAEDSVVLPWLLKGSLFTNPGEVLWTLFYNS